MGTITITGTFHHADGDAGTASAGEVWLRPCPDWISDTSDAYTVAPVSVWVRLDASGVLSVDVHDLDPAEVNVDGAYYAVTLNVRGADPYTFDLPVTDEDRAAGSIDLPARIPADVFDGDPPTFVPTPGEPGEDGEDGEDGHSPLVTVGTTTTLPPGSVATVVDTDAGLDVSLDFGIPEGVQGDKGDPGDATQADIDESIRDHEAPAIMQEAAWWAEAGSLTAAGDGLADLSGNGRDAIFGADAAAPVVLPWDGEDYIYVAQGSGNHPDCHTDPVSGTTAEVILKGRLDSVNDSTNAGVFSYGFRDQGAWSLGYYQTGGDFALRSRAYAGDGSGESLVVAVNVDKTALWSKFVKNDLACSYSTSDDGVTWTEVGTWTHGAGFGGASGVRGRAGLADDLYTPAGNSVYGMTFSVDGTITHRLDPSLASDDYLTIPNTGSAGGDWTIGRATSGFKTAVVDRPLLLFGDAHRADIDVTTMPTFTQSSLVLAYRRFGTEPDESLLIEGASAASSTVPGMNVMVRGSGQSLANQTLANIVTDKGSSGGYGQQSFGVTLDGPNVTVSTWDGTGTGWWLNGSPVGASKPVSGVMNLTHLVIGSAPGSGKNTSQEYVAAAIFDRALTADEITLVSDYLKKSPDNPHPQYALVEDAVPPSAIWVAGTDPSPLVSAYDLTTGQMQIAGQEVGSTGWRYVSGGLEGTWEGSIYLARVGGVVSVKWYNLQGGTGTFYILDTGFRHGPAPTSGTYYPVNAALTLSYLYQVNGNLSLGSAAAGFGGAYLEASWLTSDPWPTSLPGSPV